MTDKIMIDRSVVEQALEALDEIAWSNDTKWQSDRADSVRLALRATLDQQVEQEHVVEHKLKDVRCECYGYMTHHREHMGCIRAAHTKREPLTGEEIEILMMRTWGHPSITPQSAPAFARAIEAAHGIKEQK